MIDELYDLLSDLDGVRQNPRFHPEGDALYHSLQAFELARAASADRALWAAALVHDVGKAFGSADHASVGAELLDGVVAPRVVWLVRHHLDLLEAPGATKRRLRGTAALHDLQLLRAFDVGGRKCHAEVLSVGDALAVLFDGGAGPDLSPRGEPAPVNDDEEVER